MSTLPAIKGESLKIIAITLIGWTAFSISDVMSKWLSKTHEPSIIIFYGSFTGILLLASYMIFKDGLSSLKWNQPFYCCIKLMASGTIGYTVVSALQHIPIADMYGITFSTPFISVVIAYIILKESVGFHRWSAVIFGFIGVIIIIGPQFDDMNIGILYALIATLGMAASVIVTRKLRKTETSKNLTLISLYGHFIVSGLFSIPHFYVPNAVHLGTFAIYYLLILSGIFLTTYGLTNAQSTASVTPFVYSQAIWGVLFGYIFFNDIPTLTTVLGLTIVISAGLYMIYREQQLRKI